MVSRQAGFSMAAADSALSSPLCSVEMPLTALLVAVRRAQRIDGVCLAA
jgi:hypothetical protein